MFTLCFILKLMLCYNLKLAAF